MIFIMQPDGTIARSIPSPVYQGADGANTIYLFAPSMVGNSADVAFKTPDGVWTAREPMTMKTELSEEFSTYRYCVWEYTIHSPIARLDGVVTVQFFFYDGHGVVLPSSGTTFVVGRGVPHIPNEEPSGDVYSDIRDALAAIQMSQMYGDYAARAIFAWRRTRVDAAAIMYGKGEFTFVPAETEGGPSGKTGSFVRSLTDNNVQPPYKEDGTLNSEFWEEIVNFDYLEEGYFTSLRDLKEKAETAKADAETARAGAEIAQRGALTSRNEAEAAKNTALSLAGEAAASASAAATFEANAEAAKNAAEEAMDRAQTAQEAAELAAGNAAGDVLAQLTDLKEAAETAAEDAASAQAGAEMAKSDTEAARSAAHEFAEDAQRAQEGALSAKEAAEAAAEGAANNVLEQLIGLKEEARTSADEAKKSLDEALSAKEAAETAADAAAENVRNELTELKEAAETAQSEALQAKREAQAAQSATESFKARAEEASEAAQTSKQASADYAAQALAQAQSAEEAANRAEEAAKFGIRINADYSSAEELPRPGNAQFIYLIPNGSGEGNAYDEYIWVVKETGGQYEKIGTTEIDLSAYLTKAAASNTYETKASAEAERTRVDGIEEKIPPSAGKNNQLLDRSSFETREQTQDEAIQDVRSMAETADKNVQAVAKDIEAETARAQKAEEANSEAAETATSTARDALSRADVSVRYDMAQTLTDEQKKIARANMGAGVGDSSFDGDYNSLTNKPSAVLYTYQRLTEAEKLQARANIGAIGDYDSGTLIMTTLSSLTTGIKALNYGMSSYRLLAFVARKKDGESNVAVVPSEFFLENFSSTMSPFALNGDVNYINFCAGSSDLQINITGFSAYTNFMVYGIK